MSGFTLHCGDCLEVLPTLDECSVDSIVTDPPYGLSFMCKDWDHGVPGVQFWREALRVAKPGAHLLAFGGTRTHHRLTCAIEDAGWEIRDCLMWVYGNGFPKNHDVGKAIDRIHGAEREVVSTKNKGEMQRWDGWGTALKPAWEPIVLARKPFPNSVAENVIDHGTGAINIGECRIGNDEIETRSGQEFTHVYAAWSGDDQKRVHSGRWPANVIHDGSDEVVGLFPVTDGKATGPREAVRGGHMFGGDKGQNDTLVGRWHGDSGSAARFFYCAKASKRDRDEGCEGLEAKTVLIGAQHATNPTTGKPVVDIPRRNTHPTVKPTELMRYLCRLVTRPGGVVLDPFMGSGSTGKAAIREGFKFIGIEREPEYVEIARQRIGSNNQVSMSLF